VVSVPLQEKPQTIYLPAPYAEILPKIYERGQRKRRYAPAAQALPETGETAYARTLIAGAGLLRVSVKEAGQDLPEVVEGLVQEYRSAGAEVFQVFLPLDQPWVGSATEVLNRKGFFFAAVVPRWFDADGLMLQRLVKTTQYDAMHIDSDFSKDLLKFIIQDRCRAEGLSSR
jgi:hypothetical protein